VNAPATLSFLEREPAAASPSPAPMLIVLHGWGLYERHLFNQTRDFDPRLRIIAPRAPVRIGPGVYRWFDFTRTPSDGPIVNDSEETESLTALTEFVRWIADARGVGRIYLLGHSQGGTMALSLTVGFPSLVAGCANINGRLLAKRGAALSSSSELAETEVFYGHGSNNRIVPLTLAHATRERLRAHGAPVSFKEYPIGHEINDQALADANAWISARLDRR
jgi:phospholipase/carboxylesterase